MSNLCRLTRILGHKINTSGFLGEMKWAIIIWTLIFMNCSNIYLYNWSNIYLYNFLTISPTVIWDFNDSIHLLISSSSHLLSYYIHYLISAVVNAPIGNKEANRQLLYFVESVILEISSSDTMLPLIIGCRVIYHWEQWWSFLKSKPMDNSFAAVYFSRSFLY